MIEIILAKHDIKIKPLFPTPAEAVTAIEPHHLLPTDKAARDAALTEAALFANFEDDELDGADDFPEVGPFNWREIYP